MVQNDNFLPTFPLISLGAAWGCFVGEVDLDVSLLGQ